MTRTVEEIFADVRKIGDDFARESSKIMRDTAVKLTNAAVIIAENHNQATVSIETLKALADAIAGLPLPGDKPKVKP